MYLPRAQIGPFKSTRCRDWSKWSCLSKSFSVQTDVLVQEFSRHFFPYSREGNIVAAQASDCFLRWNIKEKFTRVAKINMTFLSHNNNNVSFVIWYRRQTVSPQRDWAVNYLYPEYPSQYIFYWILIKDILIRDGSVFQLF